MKLRWLTWLKPGDWLVLLLGIVLLLVCIQIFWQKGVADQLIIRSAGKVHSQWPLSRDRKIVVPGPLGETLIEIKQGRARIVSDPSPRQYCVRQGWLQQAGAIALCLPNQVSIELGGAKKDFDSLSY